MEKYTKAANILFNCRINKKRLDKLPIDCIPKNIEEAYKIQDELKTKYLTIKEIFNWQKGTLFAFDRKLFHCSSNFGTSSKKAIVAWLSR